MGAGERIVEQIGTRQDPFGLVGLQEHLQELADRAKSMEEFAGQAMMRLGDLIGACQLDLVVKDARRNHTKILATLARKKAQWTFRIRAGEHIDSPPPDVDLKDLLCGSYSQSSYRLNLPSNWEGTIQVALPREKGIVSLAPGPLQYILRAFTRALYTILLTEELRSTEQQLKAEQKNTLAFKALANNVKRELDCLTNIFTILGQTRKVAEIFRRVLATTLPPLGAKYGSIYIPETAECLSFYCNEARCESFEDSRLEGFLKSNDLYFKTRPEGFTITEPATIEPIIPVALRGHLASLGIDRFLGFSVRHQNQLHGYGLLGFPDKKRQTAGARILKVVLNIAGPFLENISLAREFEKQVKLKSQEIIEMEQQYSISLGQRGRTFTFGQGAPSIFTERILKEVERSRSMALLGELASGVAHQIRNPLNNLVAALHLINDPMTSEEEKRNLLDGLTERVDTLNRMITEFIRYTRIPSLNLTSESINRILGNTLRQFKGWMDLAEVELVCDFDLQLPKTKMDLYLMDQVYHNIIKNAMEAMYNRGRLAVSTRKLEVKHGPKPHLEFVKIAFEDTGPGISPEDIDKVLNPFHSRKKDGLGLGLAVVDHIIRAHGGGVRVRSQLGQGTTVTLYLPIR